MSICYASWAEIRLAGEKVGRKRQVLLGSLTGCPFATRVRLKFGSRARKWGENDTPRAWGWPRGLEREVDPDRFGDEFDVEGLCDAVADVAGKRDDVVGGGVAAVGQCEGVLGR